MTRALPPMMTKSAAIVAPESCSTYSGELSGVLPMRDWLLMMVPFAAVVYFATHPDQLMDLLSRLVALFQ